MPEVQVYIDRSETPWAKKGWHNSSQKMHKMKFLSMQILFSPVFVVVKNIKNTVDSIGLFVMMLKYHSSMVSIIV